MATTMNLPASGGGDAAMDSIIDGAFSGGGETVDPNPGPTPEPEAAEPATDEPAAEPEQPEAEPPAEPEQEPETQEQAAEQLDPEDEMQADRISEDPKRGKTLHFREAKAQKLFAARDFQRQLQEIDPTITVDGVKQLYERTLELDRMLADYYSGDPQKTGAVANEFFGSQEPPEAVAAFTHQSLSTLAKAHPAIYQQVSNNVLAGLAQQRYNAAVQRTGGDSVLLEKDPDFILAANLDAVVRGSYRNPQSFSQRDPLAERIAAQDRREQEFYGIKRQERAQQIQQQVQAVERDIASAKDEEIANALKPVEAAYKATQHWKHMTRDLREAVDEALAANPVFKRQYEVRLEGFKSNPTEESRKALVTMMRQFAAHVIGKNKKSVIDAVGGKVFEQDAAARRQQQQLAQRVEPGGNNTPVRRATVKQQVQGAKGYDEAWKIVDRMFS